MRKAYFLLRLSLQERVFQFLTWTFVVAKDGLLFGISTPYPDNPSARSFYIFYISGPVWCGLKNNSIVLFRCGRLSTKNTFNDPLKSQIYCQPTGYMLNWILHQVLDGTQTIFIVLEASCIFPEWSCNYTPAERGKWEKWGIF